MIETRNLKYEYAAEDGAKLALKGIDLTVKEGEFVAIVGHNGCGKSTLAKHFNVINLPCGGKVYVDNLDTEDEKLLFEIRRRVGMVFQNPDNQIVATIVEEDVAFGVENLGIESDEIEKRVYNALDAVDMREFAKKAPHLLSGGQKQRVAIAGILAMKPKCIIFDEATAMLDPEGRKKIIDIITKLNKEEKITIILITHFMEEALLADRIVVMEKGKIVLNGTPRKIFSNVSEIKRLGLDLPVGAELAYSLKNAGFDIDEDIVYSDEFVDFILKRKLKDIKYFTKDCDNNFSDKIIEVKNISFVYSEKSVFEKKALNDISFDIFKGEIVALIGKTGSGKSTLVQTLNGLIKPTEGKVYVCGQDIWEKGFEIRNIRKKVGIVFQYPEHQLFEETVFKDAMFGPVNMGFSEEEAKEKVRKAFETVGIGSELFEKSPFELSGGQKRRVAIAGVIAMTPEVLILDEPTAGLDPFGRNEILKNIQDMHEKLNMTVVMVSHSMEEVCKIADRVIVMNDGKIAAFGSCKEIFEKGAVLKGAGISPPAVAEIFEKLFEKGIDVPKNIYTVSEAVEFFKERL